MANVTVAAWSNGRADAFKGIVEELLLPVLGEDIVMSFRDREGRPDHTPDGRFHLLIGCGKNAGNTPSTTWGIRYQGYTAFAPQGDGVVIKSGEGHVVGELYEDRLYILSNIVYNGGLGSFAYESDVFRRILEEAVVQLSVTPEERERRIREHAERQKKASRDAYIRECAKRVDKALAESRKTLESKRKESAELLQKFVRTDRECAGLEKKIIQLAASSAGELEKIGMEYDKLVSLPKVKRVEIGDGVIKVFTDTLFCTDDRDGIVHEIGQFRIDVFTNGSNDGVRWNNLTRKVGKMNAPHVGEGGNACFGTSATGFAEFLSAQEYALVALYAINFVESVNTSDSWGSQISNWPVAEKPAETTPTA